MRRRRWLAGCAIASLGWAALGPGDVRATAIPESSVDSGDRKRFLPLFPLNLVAFPGQQVLLHVFEPRYKQLMTEAVETGREFGIVTLVTGGASSIGTEMRLERVLATDEDGNMDVATRGVRVFRLHEFQGSVEGKLYSGGLVEYQRNDPEIDPEIQAALVQLVNRLRYRAGLKEFIEAPVPENLSFHVGHEVGLTQAQALRFLSMAAERDRQVYLFQHLLRTQ